MKRDFPSYTAVLFFSSETELFLMKWKKYSLKLEQKFSGLENFTLNGKKTVLLNKALGKL